MNDPLRPGLLWRIDRAWLRAKPTVDDWIDRLFTVAFTKRSK